LLLLTALKIFKRCHRQGLKISQRIKFCLVLKIIFSSAVGESGKKCEALSPAALKILNSLV
jgi:hypothetical protein